MNEDEANAALLRTILERIRAQADAGLATLNRAEQVRAVHWRCTGCGHRKHFTKPVTFEATTGSACPQCRGTIYEPMSTV